jgi:hypothetical protein
MITHRLLLIPLILILAGCAEVTSQSIILERAKAEVAMRENWADQAYIRVERTPRQDYMMWRDLTWKVSAGAFDYTDFPNYNGIRVIAGSERELTFSRDGCLTGYQNRTRSCSIDPYASTEPTWADAEQGPAK